MKQEFLEAYEKLFNDAYNRLRRSLSFKLKAMNLCSEKEEFAQKSTESGRSGNVNDDQRNITDQLQFTPAE